MIEYYELGEANLHVRLCLSQLRFKGCLLKNELRRDGLWDDLIQEIYATAWEAWQKRMNEQETRRFASRRIYAFLKAYGYRTYRGAYIKPEKPFAVVFKDIDDIDEILRPLESPPMPYFGGSNLGEPILQLLRQAEGMKGMKRSELYHHLKISAQELEWHLAPLLKSQQIVEVKRENCNGRPPGSLLLIAGAPIPEEKMVKTENKVKTERTERIRQAYFVEGKSINGIAREYHHDKRTVRRAIRSSPVPVVSSEEKELVSV